MKYLWIKWWIDIFFGRVLTQLFIVQEITWPLCLKISKWENFNESEANNRKFCGKLFSNFMIKSAFKGVFLEVIHKRNLKAIFCWLNYPQKRCLVCLNSIHANLLRCKNSVLLQQCSVWDVAMFVKILKWRISGIQGNVYTDEKTCSQ